MMRVYSGGLKAEGGGRIPRWRLSLTRGLLAVFCLLLPPSTLLLQSCGTGDDDGSRLGELIVGTWQRTDLQIEGDTDYEPEDFTYDKFVFYADGSYNGMVRQGAFITTSRYGSIVFEGSYKCDNGNLRLEFDDDEGTPRKILAQVKSFSETTLQLEYKLEENDITVRLLLNHLDSDGHSASVTSDE